MESSETRLSDEISHGHTEYAKFKRNLLNLRCELLDPNRCCCCLPLRPGFLTLAYIKLVISALLFLVLLYLLILVYLIVGRFESICHILSWVVLCLDLVDIVIGILIIVAAHKKSVKFMEIYYKYSIFVFILLMILCAVVFDLVFDEVNALLVILALFFLIVVLHFYFVLLVRSEVLKLKSNAQCQFLNNEADGQCTYNNDGSI